MVEQFRGVVLDTAVAASQAGQEAIYLRALLRGFNKSAPLKYGRIMPLVS
jgi:hypothetical protein